jgi:hypothetical protein
MAARARTCAVVMLTGVIWTAMTIWPPDIAGQVLAESSEIRPGVYQVRGVAAASEMRLSPSPSDALERALLADAGGILGPLAGWSTAWAEFEGLVMNARRDPGPEG